MLTTLWIILALLAVYGIVAGVGTLVADTTSKTITGKDGTADVTWDDGTNIHSLKCILDMFRVREVIELTTADTFCTEGVADQDPGRSQLQVEIAGLLKYDGPSAGPFIPAPQGVSPQRGLAWVFTFRTGCTISALFDFSESTADRLVNQNGRIGGRLLSKGTYVVVWDKAP